jgi:branched-chain amino acid transport system substrate-binding protein
MIRSHFLAGLGTAPLVGAALPLPIYTATLRLAVIAPQTGPDGRVGRQLVDGVRAAVDQQNQLRFQTERAFVFDTFDDRNTPADARVQANFAADNPDTVAVIGHLAATPTLAALDIYAQAQMPLIVPTVTDDRVTAKGYRNVFRLPAKDSDEGALVAAYVLSTGAKAPQVVSQDGDYGPDVANGFVRGAAAHRIDAPATQFSLDKPDYAKSADAILAKNPDCIVLAGLVADMGPLLPALRAKGYAGRIVATQGFFDADTVGKYAKDAEGLVISTNVPYYKLAPTALRDVQDYESRYGPLTPVSAYGYAAVQLVRDAVRQSGATNRLNLIRALATGGAFDTMTGSYGFAASGDVLQPNCYFYRIKDGKFAYERQAHPSGFMLK